MKNKNLPLTLFSTLGPFSTNMNTINVTYLFKNIHFHTKEIILRTWFCNLNFNSKIIFDIY